MTIRVRLPADLPRCVATLRAVHEADGYPLNWPEDPARWLTPAGLTVAWIAELPSGLLAGHAAIQEPSPDLWPDREPLPSGGLAELSRFFVARPHAAFRSPARCSAKPSTGPPNTTAPWR